MQTKTDEKMKGKIIKTDNEMFRVLRGQVYCLPARVPIPTDICCWAASFDPSPLTRIIMLSGTTPLTGRITPPISAGATPTSSNISAPSLINLAPNPNVSP